MSEKNYTLTQLGWKTFFNQQLTLDNLEQAAPYRITQVFRNRLIVFGENGELNLDLAQYPILQGGTVGDWLLIPNTQSGTPVLLERQSVFQRKSPTIHSPKTRKSLERNLFTFGPLRLISVRNFVFSMRNHRFACTLTPCFEILANLDWIFDILGHNYQDTIQHCSDLLHFWVDGVIYWFFES